MKQFKIRCSAIGKIMTNGRGSNTMGKTAQSYCQNWLKEQIYNREKEFTSKQTDKGNINEDEAIDFAADWFGWGLVFKNETRFEDDYKNGTPDLVLADLVPDIKCSWDWSTFPLFDSDLPNKDYWWQLQGYMDLTGKKRAKVVYVLTDTPDHLIQREAVYYARNNGYDPDDFDIYEMFRDKMTYPDTPKRFKIRSFDVEYDADAVKSIHERVELCRDYIAELEKSFVKNQKNPVIADS
ncbi:MAG: hypothetical protein GWN62_16780 [Aliifodinibius sp.]|nr:hypothetical protein [Fodinibius sp.]